MSHTLFSSSSTESLATIKEKPDVVEFLWCAEEGGVEFKERKELAACYEYFGVQQVIQMMTAWKNMKTLLTTTKTSSSDPFSEFLTKYGKCKESSKDIILFLGKDVVDDFIKNHLLKKCNFKYCCEKFEVLMNAQQSYNEQQECQKQSTGCTVGGMVYLGSGGYSFSPPGNVIASVSHFLPEYRQEIMDKMYQGTHIPL